VSFHRLLIAAALTGGMACAAPFAEAREPAPVPVASVAVAGVDIEQVAALGAGVPLNFTAFGTPGALVSLRIEGGRRVLELQEVEAGVYEGSYLIDGLDAIRPESRVTVTLQKNGAVAYAALDEPLLLARGTVPWNIATRPAVEPAPAPPLGTPVPPVGPAARPPTAAVTPPLATPPVAVASTTVIERTACGDCAVVESVRAVENAPSGGVIGTIGGAIAGAILGKELGEAHKQRMLTLLGAIGGAVAGRQIERHATQSTQYEVDLRLADGTLLRRRYEQAPPFAVGATIRLGTPMRGSPAPAF
jgi:outer membrane lipoprotein SlyB